MLLAEAKLRLADARQLLAGDTDPSAVKKAEKQAQTDSTTNTFERLAMEWHGKQAATWTPSHSKLVLRILTQHLLPSIGALPIAEITAPIILHTLKPLEIRGVLETARRARTIASALS